MAAARLCAGTGRPVRFVGRLGNDSYSSMLEAALRGSGVDVSGCAREPVLPSGQGIVLLEPDGTASSVVVGGANAAWPQVGALLWGEGWEGLAFGEAGTPSGRSRRGCEACRQRQASGRAACIQASAHAAGNPCITPWRSLGR